MQLNDFFLVFDKIKESYGKRGFKKYLDHKELSNGNQVNTKKG